MGNQRFDPGSTYVLEATTITGSLSLEQLGLLATADDDFIEIDLEAAIQGNPAAKAEERYADTRHTIAFVASKLCRALMRAHCALSLYEGLHAAHKEHLQWIGGFDRLPLPLGPSLDKLILDLTTRIQLVNEGRIALSAAEAQEFIERIEEALDLALIALDSNHRRSLT